MKLKYFIYFPIVLCFQFCHKAENFSNCKNLHLSIVLNHTDSFNLEEDIFVRKFWDKKIKVKVNLTTEEKNKIVQILNQHDFFSIPNYSEYKSYRIIPADKVEIDYCMSSKESVLFLRECF